MALSNSERQRRFRTKRLGAGGRHERISCVVTISAKRSIERLASYFGCTITEMIERLIKDKTAEVLQSLGDEEMQRFYEEAPSGDD